MKHTLTRIVLVALAAVAFGGCASEYHLNLALNADGTVALTQEIVLPRELFEEELEHQPQRAGDDEGWVELAAEGVAAPPPEADGPAKPLVDPEESPDEKFIREVREMMMNESSMFGHADFTAEIESIALEDANVRIKIRAAFDSLESFVGNFDNAVESSPYDHLKLDKTEDGKLRLKLTPSSFVDAADIREGRGQIRASGMKASIVITMPGEVSESTLPKREGSTTRFDFDAASDESIDQMIDLLTTPLVIVADAGALDLTALPLDSAVLSAGAAHADAIPAGLGDDLQIVEVGEDAGFIAEGLMVTVQRVHYFPAAEQFFADQGRYLSQQYSNSCKVRGRLYAPRGKEIVVLDQVQLVEAVDNLNRRIEAQEGGIRYITGGDGSAEYRDFTVDLSGVAPDAQSIEQLRAHAVVQILDRWRSQTFTDPRSNPNATIDLSEVLPGTTMTFLSVQRRDSGLDDPDVTDEYEGRITIKVTGPPQIQLLRFEAGMKPFDSHSYGQRESIDVDGDTATRELTLQFTSWDHRGQGFENMVLIVRYPEGLQRLRVPILLEALDLP